MSQMKVYDFVISAGGSFPLDVVGEYFLILTSTGVVEVRSNDNKVMLGPIGPGMGSNGTPFKNLRIFDKSGAANAGTILIADTSFINQQVFGNVSVIDGEKARTLAGGMFAAAPFVITPVAAQYPVLQLWNPAGSGKNLICSAAGATAGGVAQQCRITKGTVAQANDVSSTRIMNKLLSGGLPLAAQARWNTNAALPASPIGLGYGIQSNSGLAWLPKGAIVITPGTGLELWGETTNTSILGNFEFFEENQ